MSRGQSGARGSLYSKVPYPGWSVYSEVPCLAGEGWSWLGPVQ